MNLCSIALEFQNIHANDADDEDFFKIINTLDFSRLEKFQVVIYVLPTWTPDQEWLEVVSKLGKSQRLQTVNLKAFACYLQTIEESDASAGLGHKELGLMFTRLFGPLERTSRIIGDSEPLFMYATDSNLI